MELLEYAHNLGSGDGTDMVIEQERSELKQLLNSLNADSSSDVNNANPVEEGDGSDS